MIIPRTRGGFLLSELPSACFVFMEMINVTVGECEWNGEPFNRVIEAENINDCYDHWMLWAQIVHADVTNIRIEEIGRTPSRLMAAVIPRLQVAIPVFRRDSKLRNTNYNLILVDLKFIMADISLKPFIYDRIKSEGPAKKPKLSTLRARWLYRDHCEFKNKLLSRATG